jgi:hypothetical protein
VSQEKWDTVFGQIGRSCPARRADESSSNYERRLASIGQRYIPASEEVASIDFARLPDDAVDRFSAMAQEAVTRCLWRTDNMQPGEMREVFSVDPNSGQRIRNFVGPDSFVKSMGLPTRRVVKIFAPMGTALFSSDRRDSAGFFR